MINLDEEALICDLAEVYHIYNMEDYKPSYIGILANGLRESSRIKMKLADSKMNLNNTLQAAIADRLSILIWQNTEDGHKGINKPQSILESFIKGFTRSLQQKKRGMQKARQLFAASA